MIYHPPARKFSAAMADLSNALRFERRPLGNSKLRVSPVALGTWPMAGVTSPDVANDESLATLRACQELGINFIDTAYCYGYNGESETLIRQALSESRAQFVLATKGGIHYNDQGMQANDARPEMIWRACDASLQRLGTDYVDLYYLHSPDPNVPIAESAGAIRDLISAGKVRYAGASNCSLEQIQAFHAVCPVTAVQLPYNMLQRDIEQQTVPWCREHNISVIVYWALMKGLLAGRLTRLDQLADNDARRKYPMYQGDEWEKNQTFVNQLREIASTQDTTVAQVVVNWTIQQPGITVALCGAKHSWQLEETAAAMTWQLTAEQCKQIEAALVARGVTAANRVFR